MDVNVLVIATQLCNTPSGDGFLLSAVSPSGWQVVENIVAGPCSKPELQGGLH